MIGGAVEAVEDPYSVEALGAEATARALARALLIGDSLGAATLFAADARLITPDGTEICGRAGVAQILDQITSSARPLEIHAGRTTVCGDIALSSQRWHRSDSGTRAFESSSTARLVLARSSGFWKIVIASPWD